MKLTIDNNIFLPVVGGRMAAEAGSFMMATGIVPLLQNIAPDNFHKIKHEVAEKVVLPRLAWFEKHMLKLPAFDSANRKMDAAMNDEQKAEVIASALVNFGTMAIGGVTGHLVTQHTVNHFVGLPAVGKRAFGSQLALDKGVSWVGIVAGQYLYPHQAQKASDLVGKTLNVSPETSATITEWKLPEIVGATAGSTLLWKLSKDVLKAEALRR